jgi:hypothetical protein
MLSNTSPVLTEDSLQFLRYTQIQNSKCVCLQFIYVAHQLETFRKLHSVLSNRTEAKNSEKGSLQWLYGAQKLGTQKAEKNNYNTA